jgi:WD40 repeat protein/tetratricopeptide (TPR) repeat protein
MSENTTLTDIAISNQHSLKRLIRAIALSKGQFSLILVRCNYTELCKQVLDNIRSQTKDVNLREVFLSPSTKALHTTIVSELFLDIPAVKTDCLPTAVMVFGLESVTNLEDLLSGINQARDIYADTFSFPIVLWLKDEVGTSLSRFAPDFKSWAATTIKFEMAAPDLVNLIQQQTQCLFDKVIEAGAQKFLSNEALLLDPKSQQRREIESARNDLLRLYEIKLEPQLEASLEFVLGRDNYVNDNINEALLHYQRSLELWEEEIKSNSSFVGNRERGVGSRQQEFCPHLPLSPSSPSGISSGDASLTPLLSTEGDDPGEWIHPLPLPSLIRQAVVMFHLGLCYRRLADLQPAANISFWQNALNWFKQCLDIFETIKRKDLSAKFIFPACEVLQRLEQWDDLSQLASYSLGLHQSFANKTLVAQDYGFLCVVAASKSDWVQAHELASTALSIAEEVPEVSRSSESWYLLLLGRTLRNLSEWDEAVNTLEWAKVVCEAQYEPSLYLEIVEELRSLYFCERHDYLEAFKLKREKIQIEHQYGFRAFIGASQLQPQRYRINPVLQPQKISSTPDQVAQEIAASGRQQDVHHLLEKMTRADCKLTVVHGPSGVGKSSIIKAGLVPALKQNAIGERMALPIVLSVYTDWITALGRSLNQVIARTSISLAIEITVDVILEKLRLLADNNYTIILIFDQLEEFFFVKQDTPQRIEFYKFFNKCLNIPFVKVILSLREDYLHYLLEFERLSYLESNDSYNLGVINKNILDKNIRYYLGKFTCQDANSIIHSLTERSHYQLSDELIDKLVEDLAGETHQVHPIELQIVGAQLEAQNITTLGEYQRSGGSEKLVQHWLEKVIYDCGQENEELSWKLLFELTDEKGTRPLKTKAELVTAIFREEDAYEEAEKSQAENFLININQNIDSAFSKALKQPSKQYEIGNEEIQEDFIHSYNVSTLELILEILVGSGLVLRVLQESGERYQLVHDYLVKPIRVRNDYGIIAELEKIRFEKTKAEVAQKLSQEKLNSILQKRLREARLAGFALAVMSATIGGLWWQADLQKKAAISQSLRAERSENNFKIGALTAASEALFASNKEFDALIESLRAWRKIKSGHGIQPDTRMRVVTALQQAVYGVTEVNRLEGHKDIVWDVNFSPDGKLLASGSRDKSVKIWRTDGSLLQTLKGHDESITSLTFSPDGSLLASASRDNTVKIWRKNSTTGEFDWQPVTTLGHSDWVDKVSFSPDGKLLVTGSKDETVRIWRSDGKLLKTLLGHQGWINWVTFSPDGKLIASASDDNTVKIWSREGTLLTTLPGHEEGITVVNFSPDGKILASAGRNGIVKLWRREQIDGEIGFTYRAYKNLEQHKGTVWSLNFDLSGEKLASAGDDNTINLIDVSSGKLIKAFKGHSDAVVSVSFSPDNQLLASASYDKSVKLWSLNPPKLPVLEGHSDRVLSVAWSPDGKILASSSRDNTVKLWQRQPKNTGFDTRLYKTLLGHSDLVASVSFHPSGKILASAGYDKTIKLWQRDGQLIKTLQGHNDSVTSISFSPDGRLLASASKDRTVKLWNQQGELLKTLKGHQERVNSVRFSTDSQVLASASDDQTVKLWKRDGVLLKTFLPHSGWVLGVSFSPSDNLLASASWDNTVRLWRWDGTLLKTLLKGYGDSVSNVTFSPNGKILAAASWDSTVKLWSTEGKLIKALSEHHAPVLDVSFSPDGQTLASASDDNTIVLWNLDLKNLLAKGCHWVGDYLQYNRNVDSGDRNLCQGIS